MHEHDLTLDTVEGVLAQWFPPAQARQALGLWPGPSSGQSALSGLTRYCRAVAQRFELHGREAELHLHLFKALQSRHKVLHGPEGHGQGTVRAAIDDRASGATIEPVSSPGARVVQAVLTQLREVAETALGPHWVAARWPLGLRKQWQSARIEPSHQRALLTWLDAASGDAQGAVLEGAWSRPADAARAIHGAYVLLAEWLGPVAADAGLAAIVKRLEASSDPALRQVRQCL